MAAASTEDRRAPAAQLLGAGAVRRRDPDDRHRRAPEFRHFPEADRGRPGCRARAVVVRERAVDAADGGAFAVCRQYRRPLRHGAHRRRRRRALCRRHADDRGGDRGRDADAGNILCGIGTAAAGFGPILGAISRQTPATQRSIALGVATAGGSFGQFAIVPFASLLQHRLDNWHTTMAILGVVSVLMVPLALGLREQPPRPRRRRGRRRRARATALQRGVRARRVSGC